MLDEKERTAVVQQFGRTYRAFMTAFEAQVNVPMPRWRIMLTLRDWTSAQPQKKLVEALGMDPGALTRQVQQLEVAGWIARSVDERDNRLTNVMLTEAGRMEVERAIPARDQFLADTMDDFPAERLRALTETLTMFEARIAALKQRSTQGTKTVIGDDAEFREDPARPGTYLCNPIPAAEGDSGRLKPGRYVKDPQRPGEYIKVPDEADAC